MRIRSLRVVFAGLLGFAAGIDGWRLQAQLFDHLKAFGGRLELGDPELRTSGVEGPKDVAAGDLDGDGDPDLAASNLDGTVTVYFNGGRGEFKDPIHLRTGTLSLRGLILADLNCDGRLDIAAASPFSGHVSVFLSLGEGKFAGPFALPAWPGARNLIAGDFRGDGKLDLVVAGPENGLRQYRACGEGPLPLAPVVERVADETSHSGRFPRPVYSLRLLRPPGASRDLLVATHAESNLVWVLAADAAGVLKVASRVEVSPRVYSIAVGPLRGRGLDALPELVTAHRDSGKIEVRRGVLDGRGQLGFEHQAYQEILVPGGPRAVEVVDLDQNGWNDLVVVVRNLDVVLT
ncbi:MAG: FG-GAP repeat domain-containing protein, partial [Thermoanaerobaculia bacterium]